jgi:very-short-patch-repair endonuclease
VLRFWNNEILENPEGVMQRIVECIHHPHPGPLPARQGAFPDG